MRRILACALILGGLIAVLAGCRTGGSKDPLLQLSATESLAQGKALLEKKKYPQARRYLQHAFEAEPNSAAGREGLLLAADTLFFQGNNANLIQAEAKYRDFQNRFPTSDRAAYVQFQIGKSLAGRMERPDRDQSVSQKALDALRDLIRLYPTSEYTQQAQLEIQKVRQNLAEHEFMVGFFYYRYGLAAASEKRLEHLLVTYQDYDHKDKALYFLGLAYQVTREDEKSKEQFEKLRADYPQSEYTLRLKKG
jgi:outer membrane protein assembly factor BamD